MVAIERSTAVLRPGESECSLESVVESMAEPIMVIAPDYQVTLMNRAAREFWPGAEAGPWPVWCYQVSHGRERPCDGVDHPCPLAEVRASREPFTSVHEHCYAGSEMRLVEIIASPLWGPSGEFDGVIESMRDVTERERSAKALEEYAGRLRALSARMAQVSEGERERLARELHDRVGENLTALGINLSIVRSQMPAEALAAVDSRLADSLALVENTTERIRDVMADLRPPVLDDYGLAAALRWYGEKFARRTGVAVQMDALEPEARAEPHVELALFRIAQEALTNVAKYARATRVHIELSEVAGAHRLVIADDGVGFDPLHAGAPGGTGGWGLLTMAERAEAVGGRWNTVSAPGEGTRIIVKAPG